MYKLKEFVLQRRDLSIECNPRMQVYSFRSKKNISVLQFWYILHPNLGKWENTTYPGFQGHMKVIALLILVFRIISPIEFYTNCFGTFVDENNQR